MEKKERKLYYLSFTERGRFLAEKLAALLGGEASTSAQAGGVNLWTERYFNKADGLIYIGAAGIAVRAIAPFIKSKTTDPAVIVMDEGGSFVIPVLSGHLGGANDLARELADVTGALPVITTATDVSGRFAVDEWAKRQQCAVKDPKKIVRVSAKILAGKEVLIRSDWPVSGEAPEFVRELVTGAPGPGEGGAVRPDVTVSIRRQPEEDTGEEAPLQLIPRIAVLGVGCRRGTEAAYLEKCFSRFLEEAGIEEGAVCAAASIDLKKDEPGLLQFCRDRQLPFHVYTAEQLLAAEGDFSASTFVKKVTGVDNVCERSAVCAVGSGQEGGGHPAGELTVRKTVFEGVTMALAVKPYYPNWSWQ